jgi:hypothetical protein
MEVNELRIGNFVVENSLVTELKQSKHGNEIGLNDGFTYNQDRVNPIPLTEEWLLKFGFEKIGINFQFNGISIWFSSYSKSFQLRYCLVGSEIERKINIESIHQLQNIYFALTNNELKL